MDSVLKPDTSLLLSLILLTSWGWPQVKMENNIGTSLHFNPQTYIAQYPDSGFSGISKPELRHKHEAQTHT